MKEIFYSKNFEEIKKKIIEGGFENFHVVLTEDQDFDFVNKFVEGIK
ncbi:MAG: hypothetical protein U9Q99_02790 [Nanoarchaeota archaeon]|nr:hypothetical protein [Nanoarchaeota archaeon]